MSVFTENLRWQLLKRSSNDGPKRSITITLKPPGTNHEGGSRPKLKQKNRSNSTFILTFSLLTIKFPGLAKPRLDKAFTSRVVNMCNSWPSFKVLQKLRFIKQHWVTTWEHRKVLMPFQKLAASVLISYRHKHSWKIA